MAEDIILSGEGLLRAKIAKSQSKVLPTRGQKFNIANGSWLETTQIETLLDERQEWIAEEKTEKRSQLSEANWLQDLRVAEVTKKVGSCWQSFGVQKDRIYLQPEEALFLIETTCLELLFGGVPVSVQQGYSLLLQNQEELENYRVYRELMQVGYRTRRSKEISFDQNCAPCEKSSVDGTASAGQPNKIGPASTDLSNSKSSAEVDGVTEMPEMTEGQSGKENGSLEQKNKEEVTLSEPVVETPNGKSSAEVNLATISEAVEGQGEKENGSVEQKSREEVTLSEPELVEIPITKSSAEVNGATEMAIMKEGEVGKGIAELKNKEVVTLSESELTVEDSIGHSDQPVVDSDENSTANGVAICEDIVPLGLVNETSVDETEGVSVKKARPSSPTLLVEVTGQDSKRPKMDTPLEGEAFIDADSSSSGIKRTVEERNQDNSEDEPILKKNRASNLFPSAMQVFACTEEDDIIVLEEEATDYPASPEPVVADGDNPALLELTNDNTALPQLTNKMPNNNELSDSIVESNKAVLVQEEGLATAALEAVNSSSVSAPIKQIIKLGSLSNDTTLLEDEKEMCIGEDLSVTKVTSVEEDVSVTMVTPVGEDLSITKDTSVKEDLPNTPKLTRTIGQDVKVHSQILSSRDEPSSSGLAKAVKSGHNKTTSIPSDDDDIIVLSDSDDDESYSQLKNVSVSFKPRNHSIFPNVTITRVHRPTEESKESDHEVYDLDEVLEDTAMSPEPENHIIQKLAINYTTVKPAVVPVRPILTNVKATVTAIKPVSLPVQKSHELDILFVDKVVRESPGSPTNQLELESSYAPKMIPGKFPFLNRKDIAWKMGNRSGIGLESALKVCATPSTPPFIQFGSAVKDWDTGDDDIIILSDDDDEESDDESDVIVLSDDGDDESSNKAVPTTPPSPVLATQAPKVEPTVVVPKPANKRPYRKHNSDNENDETDSVNEATLKLEDGGVKPAELPSGKPETPRGLFVPTGIVPFVWDSSVLWGNVPDTLREVADELKRMKKRMKMMPNSQKKIEMIDKFETLLYPFSEQVYKKYVQKRNDKLAAQSRKGKPKFAKVRKPVITEQLSSGSGGSSGSESDTESNFPEALEEIIDITAGDDERDRLLAMVPSVAGLKKIIIPIPSAQFLPRNVDPPFPFYTWENGKCAPSILVDRVSESNPAVKKSPAPSRCSSVSSSPALSQCTTVVPYIPPPAMPERSVHEERNGLPGYAVYSSSFSSRRFGVNPWTDNKWGAFQLHVFGRGTPFGFQNFGPNHCPTPGQFQRHRVPSYNSQRNYGQRGRGQQHRQRGQRYVRENLRNSTEGQETLSLNEPSSVKDNSVATPGTNQDSEPVVKTERLGPEEMSALPKVKGVTNIVSWKDFKERVVVPSLKVKQEVETTNQAASVGSILDRLSVIKNVGKPTLGGTCTNPVKPTFDLFAPDVRYRKSGSDPPNFRLAISRGLSVPSGEELQPLLSHCEGTTRAVVAVPLSSVLYFEFAQFEIPNVSDYKS